MSEKLFLSELISNLGSVEKVSETVFVQSVKVFKANNIVKIALDGEAVSDEDIRILKSSFQSVYSNFDIQVEVLNSAQFKIPTPEDVKNFIARALPSSVVWLTNCHIEIDGDTSIIYVKVHSEINYNIIVNNKDFVKSLEEEYYPYVIKFEYSVDEVNCADTIIDTLVAEEEIFAKNLAAMNGNASVKKIASKNEKKPGSNGDGNSWGRAQKYESMPISELRDEMQKGTVAGEVFKKDKRELPKNNKILYTFAITDHKSSVGCKIFAKMEDEELLDSLISKGEMLQVQGELNYDPYARAFVVMAKHLKRIGKARTFDNSLEKRVELHLHTKMSSMDGISSISEYVNRAKDWGHNAIAITDHGVVQGFPEAMEASSRAGIKMLYGVEGYLVDDNKGIGTNFTDDEYSEFVVFDVETTGFSARNDKITEIGAVKIVDGKIVDRFSQLINPEKEIPPRVVEITGITQALVADCPTIEEVLPDFVDFIGDAVLVAHNAGFDIGFMRANYGRMGFELNNAVIDTLEFSRNIFKEFKNHKLGTIAKNLNVSLENAHRAVHDAEATAEVFLKMLEHSIGKTSFKMEEINALVDGDNIKGESFHIIIFAQNYTGLKNLYKIVSESHLKYFYKKPRIPKSLIKKYREGLLLGTACEAGELYKSILSAKSDYDIDQIVSFYDFLEVQPIANNMHLVRNGMVDGEAGLQNINKKIYALGQKHNKLVVATGDVHFLEPRDGIYREILMTGQGFRDASNQPPLYFKNTETMLNEFSYFGDSVAKELVITNTQKFADSIDEMKPIPDGTFPPEIENSENELKNLTYAKAHELYGEVLPEIVEHRLSTELGSIIKHGYAVLYMISQKLVKKSNDDGYIVGSRGSVGSSFVATMSGITEVNPLPPHYRCPKCSHTEFIDINATGIFSGVDLPDKVCPECGETMEKDGHDIPFEVFLGFDGDKEPDIDLNFAGEYQSTAHKYIEELFGEGYVFRAGTIGTIADKTAYGFVRKYYEEKELPFNQLEIERLSLGCVGVKRTSGQHPGGIMIVPKHKEIYDFTPIQYPADDRESGVITTHFDYNAISGRILKLDILGHDGPTILKMLETFTNTDSHDVPLNEERTMSIFSSSDALNIDQDIMKMNLGTLGIPEFGTKFVRQMLLETKPSTFAELVRISGLSHGTNVWINNAQDLVKSGEATLKDIISTREDIMNNLLLAGAEKKTSFTIMEGVRKGRGLTEEQEELIATLDLPSWYADSCKKIEYMFPKAHAVAYVTLSFRIAYYKVYHPLAFYATYFTTKILDFDGQVILRGREATKEKMREIEENWNESSNKEKSLYAILEVAMEMFARGYEFGEIDLYSSDAKAFDIVDGKVAPPLRALTGLGESVANNIVAERTEGQFLSIEDFAKRTKASKTVIELLKENDCLNGLPDTNQLDFFGM